jgi:hypothetical protein
MHLPFISYLNKSLLIIFYPYALTLLALVYVFIMYRHSACAMVIILITM